MKKVICFLCIGLFMVQVGCKSESDVLATYENGKITRGDLYAWLDSHRMPRENILKKKSQQESKLKDIAMTRLTADEARKAGFNKSEDYKFLFGLLKGNYYAGYIKRKISDNSEFSEDLVKAGMIKVYVKNYKIENNKRIKLSDAEVEKKIAEEMVKAKSIVKELDSGADFSELAKKYSDDYTKKKGGDIGYISKDMKGPEFSEAAFSLKEDEYTKDPIRIGNSIYIIKVYDKKTVTQDSIYDVIEDKPRADRIKKSILRDRAKNFEDKLAKADDVKDYIDSNISKKNPSSILFQVGDEKYTVADLNRLIAFIEKKRQGSAGKAKIDDNIKKQMVKRLFNEKLLMREALKQGVDKDPEFIKVWELFQINALANAYKNDVILQDAGVTPQEVREEYNKNKDRLYTRKKKVGKRTVKEVMPFKDVKDRIAYMLKNKKKSKKRREWENDLLKNAKFQVNSSELEGE